MAALSGKVAKVKVTAVAPTSATGEAFTKLSTGVYQITDYTKRHWDRNATGAPIVSLAGAPVASTVTYTVNPVQGIITFAPSSNSTGTIAVTADIHYLTASYVGQTRSWEVEVETDMDDVTAFATAAAVNAQWRAMQPGLSGGTVTLGRFRQTSTLGTTSVIPFFDRLNLETDLIIDLHMQDFNRLTGFAYVEGDGWAADIESPLEESVTLRLDGPLYYSTSS